ncbi:unnamed protein product [Macrosiphum euphorbiae]|uniref:Uncharacterized protein n=1 Tax=Macrosiphum euphorbiae TaxID=13131 RepID=A0AAV0Y5P1_9HEMI|nr:unnamed protein product [Macrosiphum euphorbiae]
MYSLILLFSVNKSGTPCGINTVSLTQLCSVTKKPRTQLNPVMKKPRTQFDPENDFRTQLGTAGSHNINILIERFAQRTKIKKLHKAIKKAKGNIKEIENREQPENKHQQRRHKKVTENIDKNPGGLRESYKFYQVH